jgi:AcrR family transcriptional regulator
VLTYYQLLLSNLFALPTFKSEMIMGRKPKLNNRRELILEAAERLFTQLGLARTTMDDIAKEAQLGKGTLYLEFPTKEAIMEATVEAFHQKLHDRLLHEAQATTDTTKLVVLQTTVLRLILAMKEYASGHFRGEDMIRPPMGRPNPEFLAGLQQREVNLLTSLIIEAQQHNELPASVNCAEQAKLLRLSLSGVFPPFCFLKPVFLLELETKQLLTLFIKSHA